MVSSSRLRLVATFFHRSPFFLRTLRGGTAEAATLHSCIAFCVGTRLRNAESTVATTAEQPARAGIERCTLTRSNLRGEAMPKPLLSLTDAERPECRQAIGA